MSILTTCLFFILVLSDSFVSAAPTVRSLTGQIPIVKKDPSRRLKKRQGSQTGAVGLGDVEDSAYSVQVSIGSNNIPLIFDTGSSDLWSISTDCTEANCGASFDSTPQISSSSLQSATVPVTFDYGDSAHPTFASGVIGSSSVSVAGLKMDNQFLAACNQTNSNVSDVGLSGIFGLGFPSPLSGSVIVSALMNQTGADTTDAFISLLPTQGPFMSRLVTSGQLQEPMFTVTLQRETVEVGGNLGQLTIGGLPGGVSNNSLTWVPVRLYTPTQGGLPPPTSNPNEVYPIRWEVPLDDVILNGTTLPKPKLQNGVSYTALVDSGTSFLAGPESVVDSVYSILAGSQASGTIPFIPCTSPVNLSFVIGGKTFPVDPRDFLSLQQNWPDCDASSLLSTDPPSEGSLMSWVLGDPFMKSNLVAFYLGNLTHPSVDPPRMGFLSTVPSNADALLQGDVIAAQSNDGFIATSVAPPMATNSAAVTNTNGVAQAATGTPHVTQNNGALLMQTPIHFVAIVIMTLEAFIF